MGVTPGWLLACRELGWALRGALLEEPSRNQRRRCTAEVKQLFRWAFWGLRKEEMSEVLDMRHQACPTRVLGARWGLLVVRPISWMPIACGLPREVP